MTLARIILGASMVLLCSSCVSQPKYVEGTSCQVGAYVPVSGQIYGLEVVNYLAGCKVQSVSNDVLEVTRTYSATNDYFWGMVQTHELSQTSVHVQKTHN